MRKKAPSRGGKREGAGRPSLGKKTYSVSLNEASVNAAKARADNFSGLLDRLLVEFLRA